MERVKVKSKFKKGRTKTGGRAKGTRNRMTLLLKDGIEESLRVKGDALVEKAIENPQRYGHFIVGGVVAGLMWLMEKEPGAYTNLVAKLLPMQLHGKLEGEVNHKFNSVEDFARELRARGLPVPPKLIDVTPPRPTPSYEDDDVEDAEIIEQVH
jgi:hypothetical protein